MNSKYLASLVIAATAILIASSAVAESEQASIPLWRDFTTTSTKAEIKTFKATWPKKKVEVIVGCSAEMVYRYVDGKLVTIMFLGQDREADCFNRMYGDFEARFGKPELRSTTFGSVIGVGTGQGVGTISTISEGVINIWREGSKKTKLVRAPSRGYNLIFTVREDKYIY